ncbi:MAG: hypothetical protein AAF311_00900 [Pseudomonadota bacterium]
MARLVPLDRTTAPHFSRRGAIGAGFGAALLLPGRALSKTPAACELFDSCASDGPDPGKKRILTIDPGTYRMKSRLDLSDYDGLHLQGDVELDFTGMDRSTVGPVPSQPTGYVVIDAGPPRPLPTLLSDVTMGSRTIRFGAPPGLAPDEWFCLYDTQDHSFSPHKANYRQGEWLQVASVDAADVVVKGVVMADYSLRHTRAGAHPGRRFDVTGSGHVTIRESQHDDPALNALVGLYARGLTDPDLSAFRPTQADYAGMLIDRVIGLRGEGYDVRQSSSRTPGLNYGMVLIGCQDFDISGKFHGYNHAVSVGGGSGLGVGPCRDGKISGRFSTEGITHVGAFSFHGHCDRVEASGTFHGGVSGGGRRCRVRGRLIGDDDAFCVYVNQLADANLDFRGCRMEMRGDPAAKGFAVVDIGVNSVDALSYSLENGGTIDLRDVVIDAPEASLGVFIRNRGLGVPVTLLASNMTTRLAPGGNNRIQRVWLRRYGRTIDLALDGTDASLWKLSGVRRIGV